MINTYLPPILHRFWHITVNRSKIAILHYPSSLTPQKQRFPWDDLREIFSGYQRMAKVPNAVEILPKIWTAWVGCTGVTDDRRQTDRQTGDSIYSERERESTTFTFAKKERRNLTIYWQELAKHAQICIVTMVIVNVGAETNTHLPVCIDIGSEVTSASPGPRLKKYIQLRENCSPFENNRQ